MSLQARHSPTLRTLFYLVLFVLAAVTPAPGADKELLRVDFPGWPEAWAVNHWVLARPAGGFLLGQQVVNPPGAGSSVIRLGEMGDAIGPRQVLSPLGGSSAAAYDPSRDEYFVVSEDFQLGGGPQDPPHVAGRFLESDGSPFWIEIKVLDKPLLAPTDTVTLLQVAYNGFTDDYLVSALVDAGGGLGELWVERVDAQTGFPSGSPQRIVAPITFLRSHSLTFVPVADAQRPSGWYLLTLSRGSDMTLYMLDHTGAIVPAVWDCNQQPPLPVRTAIPIDLGTVEGESYHADAAYGVVDGEKRLMVVWEDLDNTLNGIQASAIWGSYLDASITRYCGQAPVFTAKWIGATWWHNFRWWTPKVAYAPGQKDFLVVWRELSGDYPQNDVIQEHIRAQWVEDPSENFVLSRATGSYPGIERPEHPAIAVSPTDHWLVTWDDQRANTATSKRAIYGAQGWHPSIELFWDDFETGDLTRWSTLAP